MTAAGRFLQLALAHHAEHQRIDLDFVGPHGDDVLETGDQRLAGAHAQRLVQANEPLSAGDNARIL